MLAGVAGMSQRGGGVAHGTGRPAVIRPSAPPLLNPWANPYLTFAQRLAATVSGSWAGTLPGPVPGFRPRNFGVGNGWPQSYGPAAAQPWPGFDGYGLPQNAYPIYAAAAPVYAPPPPPPPPPPLAASIPMPIPFPPQNVAEPPSSTQISPRHAIGRAAEDAGPERVIDAGEAYPAVIELRNGSVYTVTSYWTSGKAFHFITTRFDHYQVPFTLVERVFPRQPGPASDPMPAASAKALPPRGDGRTARKRAGASTSPDTADARARQ
jgi:hypothetical protein